MAFYGRGKTFNKRSFFPAIVLMVKFEKEISVRSLYTVNLAEPAVTFHTKSKLNLTPSMKKTLIETPSTFSCLDNFN